MDRLGVGRLQFRGDLPGGASRLYRDATGYEAIFVNGIATVRGGRQTGERPGRTVRPT